MKRNARSSSRCSSRSRLMICACTETSSAEVGSSSTTQLRARWPSARAIPTRCCWPPESWCGSRSMWLRPEADHARTARRPRRAARARGTIPCTSERLGDERRRRGARVERVERVLEDHLHLAAAQRRSAGAGDPRDRARRRAATSPARRLLEAQHAAADGRLAAAALADEAPASRRRSISKETSSAATQADAAPSPVRSR